MNSIIGPALIGKNPTEQTKLDNFMVQQLDRTVNEWGWCKQKRYDPDPAAKAAAATVLASKLGVDSGLKVYMGDDTKFNPPTRMSSDVEHLQSSGLRKCKQSVSRSSSAESALLHQLEEEIMQYAGPEGPEMSKHNQLIVEHQNPTSLHTQDGGWIARIAAWLVGEDPT